MDKTLLCFGFGYSARALARHLPEEWQIIGTSRAPREMGRAAPLLWPGGDPRSALDEASHVLISAAPGAEGDPVLAARRDEIAARAGDFRWVGYLSTTGVYGDHRGGWVDEETPLTPATERGRWRVAAEADWQSIPGLPLHIFRLAGIYGPGRGPFAKVRAGTARRIIKQGQVFSRIHVDDIAAALALSMARPRPGAIYNLCDDDPAPPEDVIGFAAALLGLPIPPGIPFAEAEMSPMARSFYAESKRVRNDKIKRDLGLVLRYPDYRAGLRALLSDEPESGGE